MKLSYLAVLGSFFLGHGASETVPALADVHAAPAIVGGQTVVAMPAAVERVAAAMPQPVLAAPELPKDMRVVVQSKGGKTAITLVRPGHVVTLLQGDVRAFGHKMATLTMAGSLPIRWETSHRSSLDTLGGELELDIQPGVASTARIRPKAQLSSVGQLSSARHQCRAFEGSNGSTTVLCRVESYAAGAARVFGDKPQQGISTISLDDRKFFRMELETGTDGVDAVVVGYFDGARGQVIRAESSLLPGETKPSFSLLSAARSQPIVFRIRHPHRFHERDFF